MDWVSQLLYKIHIVKGDEDGFWDSLCVCRCDGAGESLLDVEDVNRWLNRGSSVLIKNSQIDFDSEFFFIGRTEEEKSLVCMTEHVPGNVTERDDGWKAFRIEGVLDFSLIGILSKISALLAENEIGIFAISTYNTDYILTKKENYAKALEVLEHAGYDVIS